MLHGRPRRPSAVRHVVVLLVVVVHVRPERPLSRSLSAKMLPTPMLPRLAALVLLIAGLRSCVAYEYEHEFWLEVDGSGTVFVTGRPELWAAFKGFDQPGADGDALKQAARALFERSGVRVRKVTLTRRHGRPYLFVAADFDDVNRLGGTPAFPDLQLRLAPEGGRLRLQGSWGGAARAEAPADGLLAVRFHLPSKIFWHHNADDGVERGNIVGWREDVAQALHGRPLEFAALMDQRSILFSTVSIFAGAIAGGLAILAAAAWWVVRTGRRREPAVIVPERRAVND